MNSRKIKELKIKLLEKLKQYGVPVPSNTLAYELGKWAMLNYIDSYDLRILIRKTLRALKKEGKVISKHRYKSAIRDWQLNT